MVLRAGAPRQPQENRARSRVRSAKSPIGTAKTPVRWKSRGRCRGICASLPLPRPEGHGCRSTKIRGREYHDQETLCSPGPTSVGNCFGPRGAALLAPGRGPRRVAASMVPPKKLVDSLSPAALGAPRFDTRLLTRTMNRRIGVSTGSRLSRASGVSVSQQGEFGIRIKDGAILDQGNTIRFADGNEMTNSPTRAPDTGSICLGIWVLPAS